MSEQVRREGRNRLARERSPYLLQHASNPVDWYPWGDEAFRRAEDEDRPILLSIGYSTCHWCHVMERESFEDPGVARLINETFVPIKVDREERPEIDRAYMAACQAMTGQGGWPLTIFLTPAKKPFFAATYIPKVARFGRAGLTEIIPRVRDLWRRRRADVERSAEDIARALGGLSEVRIARPSPAADEDLLHQAYAQLEASFDERHAGFGRAPKFPPATAIRFLLRYWRRTGIARALEMAERTLRAMRRGGIYDQLGFGFHRYSTDETWTVPHFEKMLYDQALLAMAYTEAHQATGEPRHAATAGEILSYVGREMTSPLGGFFSAEDADSEGQEGRFYVWTVDQLREALDRDRAELAIRAFGLGAEGNFPEALGGGRPGLNVLHVAETDLGPEGEDRLESTRRDLLAARGRERTHPFKDDKVLTDWNGLMIEAFALAARALGQPEYAETAAGAARFLLDRMHGRGEDGRLRHRYRDQEAGIPAYLDDYAFLVAGLIELYQATFDPSHLAAALRLNQELLDGMWDEESGAFALTRRGAEAPLGRAMPTHDEAVPSGNAVACLNLLRLGRLTGDPALEERAARVAAFLRPGARQNPVGHAAFLLALDFALGPSSEVVVVGELKAPETGLMLREARRGFRPHQVLLWRPPGEERPPIAGLAPFTLELQGRGAVATAYVCHGGRCELPVTDARALAAALERASGPATPAAAGAPRGRQDTGASS